LEGKSSAISLVGGTKKKDGIFHHWNRGKGGGEGKKELFLEFLTAVEKEQKKRVWC